MSSPALSPQHDLSVWYREIRRNASEKSAVPPRLLVGRFAASTESSRAKRKHTQAQVPRNLKGSSEDFFNTRRPPVDIDRKGLAPVLHHASVKDRQHIVHPAVSAETTSLNNQDTPSRSLTPAISFPSSSYRTEDARQGDEFEKTASSSDIDTPTQTKPLKPKSSSLLQDPERAKQIHRISISYEVSTHTKSTSTRYSRSFRPASARYSTSSTDEQTALAALIINASKSMSLRKYLFWVTLQDVHRLQSIHHPQAYNVACLSEPAIMVLRNVQVLEVMYRPGRVWLPSDEARHLVATIHETLLDLKTEMEDRYHDVLANRDAMSATEFVDWASHEYRIGNKKLELSHGAFRHNPDSLKGQQDAVLKAMAYYQSPSVLYESSATNIFAEIIIKVLATYLVSKTHRPIRQVLKGWFHGKDSKEGGPVERRPSTMGVEDVLVWQHPAPF